MFNKRLYTLFYFALLVVMASLKGLAQPRMIVTQTETFILSIPDKTIMHINHLTKEKRSVKCNGIGFLHYNNLIFVTTEEGEIRVFDFSKTDDPDSGKLQLNYSDALPMHIHGVWGFVAHSLHKKLSIIHLNPLSSYLVIDLASAPFYMTIHIDHAYLLGGSNSDGNKLIQVNLKYPFDQRVCDLHFHEPAEVKFFDQFAYIVDHQCSTISIVTLDKMEYLGTVNSHSSFSSPFGRFDGEVDTKKMTVTRSYIEPIDSVSFYHDHHIYWDPKHLKINKGSPATITLLEPTTGVPIKTYKTDKKKDVFQVGNDVYFGVELIFTAKDRFCLLHNLWPLDFPLGDTDKDAAFSLFENALTSNDLLLCQHAFLQALNHNHPKAYAIAAYAHFMECWGAPEDFKLFKDYLIYADRDYFLLLLTFYGDFDKMMQHQHES